MASAGPSACCTSAGSRTRSGGGRTGRSEKDRMEPARHSIGAMALTPRKPAGSRCGALARLNPRQAGRASDSENSGEPLDASCRKGARHETRTYAPGSREDRAAPAVDRRGDSRRAAAPRSRWKKHLETARTEPRGNDSVQSALNLEAQVAIHMREMQSARRTRTPRCRLGGQKHPLRILIPPERRLGLRGPPRGHGLLRVRSSGSPPRRGPRRRGEHLLRFRPHEDRRRG